MSELSSKLGMYGVLIGICNVKLPEFGSEIVKELGTKLQDCLQKGDLMRAKLLVR